jgi:hypothetical protein
MENLIVAILLYVAIVAIAHCPKSVAKADTDPAAPVDYFPKEEANTEPDPVAMPDQPAIIVPMSTTQPEAVEAFTVATDLSCLGVRELYKLAKEAGLKNVKKLSKTQLVEALA